MTNIILIMVWMGAFDFLFVYSEEQNLRHKISEKLDETFFPTGSYGCWHSYPSCFICADALTCNPDYPYCIRSYCNNHGMFFFFFIKFISLFNFFKKRQKLYKRYTMHVGCLHFR